MVLSIMTKTWESGGLEYLRKTTEVRHLDFNRIPFKEFARQLALEVSESQQ